MPPVNSYVTEVKVEEKNGEQTATITVRLEGFVKDEHVQLSGFAAQKSGGYAAISRDHRIGSLNPDGAAVFNVDTTPSAKFVAGEEVISGLWAAKVWLTALKAKAADPLDWEPDYWLPKY